MENNLERPLITLIIPVYNSETYLSDCVDSVLEQSYNNLEIILINDGSTDGSGEICDDYSRNDNRIRVIQTENSGVSAARNLGLEVAKGDYVAFIDSDDTVHEDYIAALYGTAEENDSDIVCCGYTYAGKTLQYEHNDFKNLQNNRESFVEHVLKNTGGTICSKLFKASVIAGRKLRFNETLQMREDLIFALQFAFRANSFCKVENYYYYYNGLNEDSLSKRDHTENRLQIRNIIRHILESHNFNRNIQKRLIDLRNKEVLFAGIREQLKLDNTLKKLNAFYRNGQVRDIIAQTKISGLKEAIIYTPAKLRSPILTYLIYKMVYGSK